MGIHQNVQSKADAKKLNGYPILCPYCKIRSFERKDIKQGHYFCENCGYITKQIMVMWHAGKQYEYTKSIGKIPYKRKSIKQLERKYDKKTNGTTEYRIHDKYKSYLSYIAGEFGMTNWQYREVLRDIVKAKGLQLFCSKCDHKTIIMGMCLYLMRADKRDIRIGDYRLITKSGLTEKNYLGIVEKYSTFKIRNR